MGTKQSLLAMMAYYGISIPAPSRVIGVPARFYGFGRKRQGAPKRATPAQRYHRKSR